VSERSQHPCIFKDDGYSVRYGGHNFLLNLQHHTLNT
jgi:hypothetical protein